MPKTKHSGLKPTCTLTLTEAAKFGDVELIKDRLAISKGSDLEETYPTSIDDCDDVSGGPLTKAAERGNLEAVKYLLKVGAKPRGGTEPYGSDNQALLKASENGHIEIVKTLLDNGANLHLQGFTQPDLELYNSALYGQRDIVHYLLSRGKYEPSSSLLAGAMINDPQIVEEILKDKTLSSKKIEDAIDGALECGSLDVLKLFITKKVKFSDSQRLLAASALGKTNILEKSLPKGSDDFDTRGEKNLDLTLASRLLKTAARFDQPAMVKWTLGSLSEDQKKFLVEDDGQGGLTHIFCEACKHSSLETLDLLIKAGAIVNFQGDFGIELPIYNATKKGRTEVCEYLINLGTEKTTTYVYPKIQDNPLDLVYTAAESGHTKTAKRLVELGCSLPQAIACAEKEHNPKTWNDLSQILKDQQKALFIKHLPIEEALEI